MEEGNLCLDTSVVIEIFKGNKEVLEKIKKFPGKKVLTVFTLIELLLNRNERKRRIYELFLSGFDILSLDRKSGKIAAEIIRKLEEKGEILPIFDILIASICIANGIYLYTLDKHFKKLEEFGLLLY